MFTSIKRLEQLLPRINIVATGATLLIAGAIGGCATIATSATDTSEVRMTDTSIQLLPNYLIGSYEVFGTDPDGKRYPRPEIVDISLAPSGALELDWICFAMHAVYVSRKSSSHYLLGVAVKMLPVALVDTSREGRNVC